MRGEHRWGKGRTSTPFGSSPHAWGTRIMAHRETTKRRFIPTCVGNTQVRNAPTAWQAVHPHMRGEHTHLMATFHRGIGSSPHAWGTRTPSGLYVSRSRFIPTCVGNTS